MSTFLYYDLLSQQEAEYSFSGFIPTNKPTNKAEDGAARRSVLWISGIPGRCQRTSNTHSARHNVGAKDAATVVEEDVD